MCTASLQFTAEMMDGVIVRELTKKYIKWCYFQESVHRITLISHLSMDLHSHKYGLIPREVWLGCLCQPLCQEKKIYCCVMYVTVRHKIIIIVKVHCRCKKVLHWNGTVWKWTVRHMKKQSKEFYSDLNSKGWWLSIKPSLVWFGTRRYENFTYSTNTCPTSLVIGGWPSLCPTIMRGLVGGE